MRSEIIFGRSLLAELQPTVNTPCVVVTMEDIWPLFERYFPTQNFRPHFVSTLEQDQLEELVANHVDARTVIGLGGGQAIDVAKYLAWRLDRPLFQVPTALSVNAPFAHRAAIRVDGFVRYVGFIRPEAVYIDYDVIQQAPDIMNRTGVGDIFCYHTAHADWRLAQSAGKLEEKWPVDEAMIAQSRAVMESCIAAAADIRSVSEHGIRVLVDALRFGGEAFGANGWNPRPIEGAEHTFFYALESVTGQHFLHGQPVGLGTVLMSLLQDNGPEWIKRALDDCGVPYRPEEMGITWDDCVRALHAMRDYVDTAGLWYTAASHYAISPGFIDAAHELVYRDL